MARPNLVPNMTRVYVVNFPSLDGDTPTRPAYLLSTMLEGVYNKQESLT